MTKILPPLTVLMRTVLIAVFFVFFFSLPLDVHAADGAAQPVDVVDDSNKTFYELVFEFIESISTLEEDVKNLDLSVVKVALYRPAIKRGEVDIPQNIVPIIESKLKNKLLTTRRLQVFECIECKMMHVSLEKDKLILSKAIESNERLKELGKKIGVDGFVIWNLYRDEKNLYLDLNIVNAETGMVAWSNQYIRNPVLKKKKKNEEQEKEEEEEPEPKQKNDVDVSLGMMGYSITRQKTDGSAGAKVDKLFSENFALMKKTTVSERVSVGLGVGYYHNITETSLIAISGLYFYPLMEIKLGPYYGNKLSLFNIYFGVGEAFGNKTESTVLLSGMNIRMRRELFASLGFINISKKTIEMPEVAGYAPTAEFGGSAYELKFGYRF